VDSLEWCLKGCRPEASAFLPSRGREVFDPLSLTFSSSPAPPPGSLTTWIGEVADCIHKTRFFLYVLDFPFRERLVCRRAALGESKLAFYQGLYFSSLVLVLSRKERTYGEPRRAVDRAFPPG